MNQLNCRIFISINMKFPQNSHLKKTLINSKFTNKNTYFEIISFLFCLNSKLNNNTSLGATRISHRRIHLKIPTLNIIYIFGGII